MELKYWAYDEFPEFNEEVAGAGLLETTGYEIGVVCRNDVQYAEVNGYPLHMNILVPVSRNCPLPMPMPVPIPVRESKNRYPCVVFVQGSGWMPQDLFMQLPYVAALAKRGYVVAIVEYRHSGVASFPAPIIDAKNAVRFLRANAKDYLIDAEKIALAGDSSGGHTALFAGMLHNDDSEDNLYPGVSGEVSGIIGLYPAGNFILADSNPSTPEHLCADSPEGREMGGIDLNERPDLCRKLTIECNIDENTVIPPVLLFHGTKDRTVNCQCSVNLYKHMKKINKSVEFYLVKGGDHGGPEFWTEKPVDIMEQFLKKVF